MKATFPNDDDGEISINWNDHMNEFMLFKEAEVEQQFLQTSLLKAHHQHYRCLPYYILRILLCSSLLIWSLIFNSWLIAENLSSPSLLTTNILALLLALLNAFIIRQLSIKANDLLSNHPAKETSSSYPISPCTSFTSCSSTSRYTPVQIMYQYQIIFFIFMNLQVLLNYMNLVVSISSCSINKSSPCFYGSMTIGILQATAIVPFLLTFLLYEESLIVTGITVGCLAVNFFTFGDWWSFISKMMALFLVLFLKIEFRKLRIEAFLSRLKATNLLKEMEQREAKEVRATVGNIAHDLRTVSLVYFFLTKFHANNAFSFLFDNSR